jgi:hypothetical protein
MTRSTVLLLIGCFFTSAASAAEPLSKQGPLAKMPPPVFLTMEDVVKGRIQDKRQVIYFEKEDWERRVGEAKHVPGPPPEGALGMFVIQDPFGDYLGFEACFWKGSETVACLYVGGACRCYRDPREGRPEITMPQSCRLVHRQFTDQCEGGCTHPAKKCERVIYDPFGCPPNLPPGVLCVAPFVTCECK